MLSDLLDRSAEQLRTLLARRETSAVELTTAVLGRAEAVDRALNAFVTIEGERALAQARQADRRIAEGADGALLGIPVSVKDTIQTAGIRTTMGSVLHADRVPGSDAPATERAIAAGATIFGKTNTSEFGWKAETSNPLAGSTLNPWDASKSPGGSSGGAAVAVATGLGPVALGTDAAGSTRIPAAMCGVVGLKPSFGTIPVGGARGTETLSHIGLLARCVADLELALSALAGPDPRDPLSVSLAEAVRRSPSDRRVAFTTDLGFAAVEPDVVEVAARRVGDLERLGWKVEVVQPDLPDPYPILDALLAAGEAGRHRHDLDDVRDRIDPGRLAVVERGLRLSAADVGAALIERGQWAGRMRAVFDPYDLVITPATAVSCFPPGGDGPGFVAGIERSGLSWAALTYPFNLTGHPALSIPCGVTAAGIPVGLQLVGRWREDVALLTAAREYEDAFPWERTVPRQRLEVALAATPVGVSS